MNRNMAVMLPQKTESSEQVDEMLNKINCETEVCDRHSPKGGGCSEGVLSVRERTENGFKNKKEAGR